MKWRLRKRAFLPRHDGAPMPLSSCHILIVDDDTTDQDWAREAFAPTGAELHFATSRRSALGTICELFQRRIIPRALVCDWVLHSPSSRDHEFYKLLGRPHNNVAEDLIANVRKLDEQIAILVYARELEAVPYRLADQHGFQVVARTVEKEVLVSKLLDDPRMEDMRREAGTSAVSA